jgi:hypothetical protein
MIDPTGALVIEVRDSLRAAGITDRVRGYEPAPGDSAKPYRRFVVISSLDVPPDPLLPITDARYSFRCYGTTAQRTPGPSTSASSRPSTTRGRG